MIENLIRRQRPIGNRQHHYAIAADVLGVLGQCDACRRGARASAGNQGNTAIDMFGRNGSCRLHFFIGDPAQAVAVSLSDEVRGIDPQSVSVRFASVRDLPQFRVCLTEAIERLGGAFQRVQGVGNLAPDECSGGEVRSSSHHRQAAE